MNVANPVELDLNAELLDALRLAGLEFLWHPGQATISSDFKFEAPCSAKWMDIKSGVEMGAYSYAVSGHFQKVVIGRYTSIGEDVQFGRGNHSKHPISNSPIFSLSGPLFGTPDHWRSSRLPSDVLPQEDLPETKVGSDVWIGHGSFIKPGVVIGDGAIIGAASVVTKDVEPFSVVAGNPARLIRMRFPDDAIEELLKLKWWEHEVSELDGIDFSDLSVVLQKVPKATGNTSQNLKRSVDEFVFTREELGKLTPHNHHFLMHPSGFEYAILQSPNRFQADSVFSEDPEKALQFYLQSVQLKESPQIYALLNGANCAASFNQQLIAGELLANAVKHKQEDREYFDATFPDALGRFLSLKEPKEALAYAAQIGFPLSDFSKVDLQVIVIGFPRCGTTSIASQFEKENELQNGLTVENFPNLSTRALEMDSLFKSFEISLLLGSVVRQEGPQATKFIDKSTVFSASKQLLSELIFRYPEAKIYAATRDPFNRSISAYKMARARFSKSLGECVEKETQIIKSLGGVRSIFESIGQLVQFLEACAGFGIDYPLIYPSLLMKYWSDCLSEDLLARVSVISIQDQNDSKFSSDLNVEELPILNSSNHLKSELSDHDIEKLRVTLNDQSLI